MKEGDVINYCVHPIHSKQATPNIPGDPRGGFPWVFGWKGRTGQRRGRGAEPAADVAELNHDETREKLRHVRRQAPDLANREAEKLVMLRPKHFWEATVRKVNKEGDKEVSADLDVKDPTTGAILHYDGVPIDPKAATPHSCHAQRRKGPLAMLAPVPGQAEPKDDSMTGNGGSVQDVEDAGSVKVTGTRLSDPIEQPMEQKSLEQRNLEQRSPEQPVVEQGSGSQTPQRLSEAQGRSDANREARERNPSDYPPQEPPQPHHEN